MSTQNFRVYAYLRASTEEQDATRALGVLNNFAEKLEIKIAKSFFENESGSIIQRPELFKIIDIACEHDVILIEKIDRLTRLNFEDWGKLKGILRSKKIKIVSPDVPTTYASISFRSIKTVSPDNLGKIEPHFVDRILDSINDMLIDMLAAFAYKDNADRKERQAQGIAKKKAAGGWKCRDMSQRIKEKLPTIIFMLQQRVSQRKIAAALGVGVVTINKINKEYISTTVTVKQKSIN
jgi:DNA invertase Pin-like site-specific DNA recombinase